MYFLYTCTFFGAYFYVRNHYFETQSNLFSKYFKDYSSRDLRDYITNAKQDGSKTKTKQ